VLPHGDFLLYVCNPFGRLAPGPDQGEQVGAQATVYVHRSTARPRTCGAGRGWGVIGGTEQGGCGFDVRAGGVLTLRMGSNPIAEDDMTQGSKEDEHGPSDGKGVHKGHTCAEACAHCWSKPEVVIMYVLFLSIILVSTLYAKVDEVTVDHDCGYCIGDDGCHPSITSPAFRVVEHGYASSHLTERMLASSSADYSSYNYSLSVPGDLWFSFKCEGHYSNTCKATLGDDIGNFARRRRLAASSGSDAHHYWTSMDCGEEQEDHRRRSLLSVDEAVAEKRGGGVGDAGSVATERRARMLSPFRQRETNAERRAAQMSVDLPVSRWEPYLARTTGGQGIGRFLLGSSSGSDIAVCPHELDWGNNVSTVTFSLTMILLLTFMLEHCTELIYETSKWIRQDWVQKIISTLIKELVFLGIGSLTVTIINEAGWIYSFTTEQLHILHLTHQGVFLFVMMYMGLSMLLLGAVALYMTWSDINFQNKKAIEREAEGSAFAQTLDRDRSSDVSNVRFYNGPWSFSVLKRMRLQFLESHALSDDFHYIQYVRHVSEHDVGDLITLKEPAWIVFLILLLANLIRYKTASLESSVMATILAIFAGLLFLVNLAIFVDVRKGAIEYLQAEKTVDKGCLERIVGKKITYNVLIAEHGEHSHTAQNVEWKRVCNMDTTKFKSIVLTKPAAIDSILQLTIFYLVLLILAAAYYSYTATDSTTAILVTAIWVFIILMCCLIIFVWHASVVVAASAFLHEKSVSLMISRVVEKDLGDDGHADEGLRAP